MQVSVTGIKTHMKRLAILLVALIATCPAWSQKETSMGNTKVNTDFTKYKTFTWAKSDPHMVGPEGYDIYFYEITPDRTQDYNRTEDMNKNRELDKTDDMNRNKDLDKTYDKDQTKDQTRDQSQRDQSYNRRDTSDMNRTDRDRAASDRATDRTDRTYQDPNKDKSSDPNQTYNRDMEKTDDLNNRRTETYSNENKPSGYVYSYTMIIPARDEATNDAIRDGISNELEGRGYRDGGSEADLIVSYQVLDQKATLHGFNNDDPAKAGGQEVRQPSDTATFALEPGSLIVSLIDAKTSEMVWHGWSSGLIENRSFLTDEAQLKEAIHEIFEEFKHKADAAKKD
jgi:hypothetical protein